MGAAVGYGMGCATAWLVNHVRLEYEGLYPVLTLALALFAYGAAASVGGNGFLAVYLAGLVLGNSEFIHKHSVIRFHDGLAWLMQIVMFLALGLLVFLSQLLAVAGSGLVTAARLMLVARPLGVGLALLPSRLPRPDKAMVAWVGLRGAVPIILATFPLLRGVPGADHVFNLVFFVVLTSVLLQGTSIPAAARWLGVDVPLERQPPPPDTTRVAPATASLREVRIPDGSTTVGKRLLDLGLPPGALVVLVRRGDHVLIPDGGTALQGGDTLLLLADVRTQETIRPLVEGGPDSPPGQRVES